MLTLLQCHSCAAYLQQVSDGGFMLQQHEGGHGVKLLSDVLLDQG